MKGSRERKTSKFKNLTTKNIKEILAQINIKNVVDR